MAMSNLSPSIGSGDIGWGESAGQEFLSYFISTKKVVTMSRPSSDPDGRDDSLYVLNAFCRYCWNCLKWNKGSFGNIHRI